jgi:predicted nucleic acid-binding protein
MIWKWREPIIIADASPLIGLAKIGRLEVLHRLANEVWVPTTVWQEVVERAPERPEVPALAASLAHCVREPDAEKFAFFRQQADEGEAAALALAAGRPDALLLMDDQRGRSVAEHHAFRYIGTLGRILRAKRAHFIVSVKAEAEALQRQGLYLDVSVVRQVLRAAGELEAE